ncbi:hypothetical protein OTU49_004220 [Cherax quadricarinatus]|uniref:Uncharacterized protein n=1 Tax=Cherax quadricarinatus TaxID=27406 RepID=A0AAW0XI66_CHEQU
MVLCWKVTAVLVVMVVAASLVEATPYSYPGYYYGRRPRRILTYGQIRKQYGAFAGLLPHKVPCCWNGYDAEGYSRNGRDLSHLAPDLGDSEVM